MSRALILASARGLCLALSLLGAGPSFAQTADVAAETPLLTLDRDKLYIGTLYGKAVEARFKAETDALIAENARLFDALEAEELDLTERRKTLPKDEFRSLAAAFDEKAERIRTEQDAKSRALTARRDADIQYFGQAAGPILLDLMRELGALAILDTRLTVLSLPELDMTEQAIARVDAVLGDGAKTAPSQAPAASP
jgi:Skp family chaperone for outer membrane proteins